MAGNGNGAEPEVQPWSADAFLAHAEERRVVKLPRFGGAVRVRPVSAGDLAREGTIPDELVRHVWEDVAHLLAEADTAEERVRVKRERAAAIDAVVCAFVEEPSFTTGTPGPGQLPVTRLPWADRLYLYLVATGEVDHLARFPGQPAPGVSTAPDGTDLWDPSVGVPGPGA